MYEQIKLDYAFDALEPHIDTLTMETHYSKHHAAYTKNLNDRAVASGFEGKPIEIILAHWKKKAPEKSDAAAVRNNGGGYYNHNLYFGHLSPNGGGVPGGVLADKINETFGSFESFKEKISAAASGQFGSGWAFLSTDRNGSLSISACPNQDNPILETEGELTPILAIDVWEHAYYLKYKNLRASYIEALFNVLDWNKVAKNYDEALHNNVLYK